MGKCAKVLHKAVLYYTVLFTFSIQTIKPTNNPKQLICNLGMIELNVILFNGKISRSQRQFSIKIMSINISLMKVVIS